MSAMDTLEHTETPAYARAKLLFRQSNASDFADVATRKKAADEGDSALSFLVETVMQPVLNVRPRSAGSNLEVIVKAAKVILEAVDDGTLTEREGDAVLTLLTENFATSRVDRILERLAEAPKTGWFTTQARIVHER